MEKIEYDDYKKMIYFHANKLHHLTGKDRDELISEGNLIFCECVNKYQVDRQSSFGTFFYYNLYYGLYKNAKTKFEEIEFIERADPIGEKENKKVEFEDQLEQLSVKAKEIVHLIFNSSDKVKGNNGNNVWRNRITKKSIYSFLIQSNWKHTNIINAFQEIKDIL